MCFSTPSITQNTSAATTDTCRPGFKTRARQISRLPDAGDNKFSLYSAVSAACPFTVPGKGPQPCVKVQWLVPALRVKVMGQQVLLQSSSGLCQSGEQIPQGPPNIVSTQIRVKGT